MECGVLDDKVEGFSLVATQPASAVINLNLDARIGKQTLYLWILGDELQVAGIDLDDSDLLNARGR
jgi:hypothetical protein